MSLLPIPHIPCTVLWFYNLWSHNTFLQGCIKELTSRLTREKEKVIQNVILIFYDYAFLIATDQNCDIGTNRRDSVVVRASASQSVDLGFIFEVESYQKTLKNDIHGFPAWRSA